MRNPERIPKILKELEELWMRYPDLRLAQLILNAFSIHNGVDDTVYYMEDEEFIDQLKKAYDSLFLRDNARICDTRDQ